MVLDCSKFSLGRCGVDFFVYFEELMLVSLL